jgi:hypothetical protein
MARAADPPAHNLIVGFGVLEAIGSGRVAIRHRSTPFHERRQQLFVMHVRNYKVHRSGAFVFDPMRSRPVFTKNLSSVKFSRRAVTMVVG